MKREGFSSAEVKPIAEGVKKKGIMGRRFAATAQAPMELTTPG